MNKSEIRISKFETNSNNQTPKNLNRKVSDFGFRASNLQRKSFGFSLLELLVVISIVTILITLAMSSFATAGKKGRDAKRKSDIKEIQNALEQFYSVCGFSYPDPRGVFYTDISC